jgi:hypothetical protein
MPALASAVKLPDGTERKPAWSPSPLVGAIGRLQLGTVARGELDALVAGELVGLAVTAPPPQAASSIERRLQRHAALTSCVMFGQRAGRSPLRTTGLKL